MLSRLSHFEDGRQSSQKRSALSKALSELFETQQHIAQVHLCKIGLYFLTTTSACAMFA